MAKIDDVSETLGELKSDVKGISNRLDRINCKLDRQNGSIQKTMVELEKHKEAHRFIRNYNKRTIAILTGCVVIGLEALMRILKL